MIYIIKDATFIFEPGQNWKIAALRFSKCVRHFLVGDNMNELYMKEAIIEAKKAYKKDDVPVGCVIVKNNKIIARAHNKKENKKNAINHAEILAISKACKKLKTWHLEECVLYTTMEPCLMCTGAIVQSRIGCIYYSISNNNFGELEKYLKKYNKKIIVENGLLKDDSEQLLKDFFKTKRK